jgi:hypothetical protein
MMLSYINVALFHASTSNGMCVCKLYLARLGVISRVPRLESVPRD